MGVLDRFRLNGRRLFITGGSRGLGREMALALADAGADVALTGRDGPSLERTASEIRALGRQAWTVQADMAEPAVCQAACGRALAEHGPFDILINNIGGRHYETAKAAVVQLTRVTAADWAPHGVTANAICPGVFMTEPNQRWARERPEVIDGIRDRTPMGTFGQPEDLGPLAVYLASDAARFMTGAALVIDGGYTLW